MDGREAQLSRYPPIADQCGDGVSCLVPFSLGPMTNYWLPTLAALAAIALPTKAAPTDISVPVQQLSEELRQAWGTDPLTRSWPWPDVVLLPAGQRALVVCPAAAAAGAVPDSTAIFCPTTGKVLLDRKWLVKDVQQRYGNWGLAYWIATGLGQAIRGKAALPGPALSPAAANLQANCLAGLLLNQRRGLRSDTPKQWLSPAFTAYAASDTSTQGTAGQRAYALFSGLGGTRSGCASKAMAALSTNSVPDPALLKELAEDADTRATAIQRQFSPENLLPRPPRNLQQGLAI
jgi:hypothetical protein